MANIILPEVGLGSSPVPPVLRTLVRRLGRQGGLDSAISYGLEKFINIGSDILSGIIDTLRSGWNAAKLFITTGRLSPLVVEQTPIVPPQTFPQPAFDRFVLAADLVGQTDSGEETERRLYTFGLSEGDIVRDILGEAGKEIWDKINDTDPQAARDFVDRFFEAHWLGRIF